MVPVQGTNRDQWWWARSKTHWSWFVAPTGTKRSRRTGTNGPRGPAGPLGSRTGSNVPIGPGSGLNRDKWAGPLPCFLLVFSAYLLLLSLIARYKIILLSNYSATYNFSTCRHYLTENHLSFPSAPRWVRHSYLSKRATIDPLYL